MHYKTPAHLTQSLFDKANRAANRAMVDKAFYAELCSRYADLLLCMSAGYLREIDPRWELLNRKIPDEERIEVKRLARTLAQNHPSQVAKRTEEAVRMEPDKLTEFLGAVETAAGGEKQ